MQKQSSPQSQSPVMSTNQDHSNLAFVPGCAACRIGQLRSPRGRCDSPGHSQGDSGAFALCKGAISPPLSQHKPGILYSALSEFVRHRVESLGCVLLRPRHSSVWHDCCCFGLVAGYIEGISIVGMTTALLIDWSPYFSWPV